MRTMPILFILIVVGYVGFELYGLHRAKERMDPVTILDKFHMADRATSRCGQPEGDDLERFQRNLGLAATRATRALEQRNPDASRVEIAEMLEARRDSPRAGGRRHRRGDGAAAIGRSTSCCGDSRSGPGTWPDDPAALADFHRRMSREDAASVGCASGRAAGPARPLRASPRRGAAGCG